MRWFPFPDSKLEVCGLPWFAETVPNLWRFPERMKQTLPEGLFEAGQQTAGARIRLRSDTGSLGLKARYPTLGIRTNLTLFNAHGISTYVDGHCWSAKIPGLEGGEVELGLFQDVPRQMREICLYLPLYGPVEILEIGVDEEAQLDSVASFAVDKPVVFYGTSITQGGCASRPGLSYQAMLARELNLDYANFGFSSQGNCQPEVAESLAQIAANCFVLDVGQNNQVKDFGDRFKPFLDILRKRQPETPVLATTPIFYNAELWSRDHQKAVNAKRETVRAAVRDRKADGDDMVFLLEADDYLGTNFTDGAVDGGHPNDLGFARMAAGMKPKLAQILKL